MTRWQANLLMLAIAVIWGAAFVAQSQAMQHMGPIAFTGVRFLIGAAVVAPLAWWEWRGLRRRGEPTPRGHDWSRIAGLGLLLALGAGLQQVGIKDTTITNAGVLTALYVPAVPLLAWLLGAGRPHPLIALCAAGSVLGAFLLSGAEATGVRSGDWWVLASVLPWAFHVLWVGAIANRIGAPFTLACVQFVVCGLLGLVWGAVAEGLTWSAIVQAAGPVLFGGVLSVGVGFTGQVIAQRYSHPADAAILLSSETLFGALFGYTIMGDRLGAVAWAGAGVVFACIVLVQLLPLLKTWTTLSPQR